MGFLTTVVGTGAQPYVVRAAAHKAPAGWTESIYAVAPASLKAVVSAQPRPVRVTNCSAEDHATVVAAAFPSSGVADPVHGWLRLEPLSSVLVEAQIVELWSYAPLGRTHVFLIEPLPAG